MARVAVVTGGTRGIGRAISVALNNAGYRVAANYGGNDQAAQLCNAETGIPAFKFDVSDFNACTEGIKAIEAALLPAPDQPMDPNSKQIEIVVGSKF